MTTKLRVSVAVTAAVGALVLSSCSPGDLLESALEKGVEKGVEAATGSEIDIDEDGGNITIQTDDGEFSMGTSAELPEGFPDEIPLVDGEIGGGMRFSEGDKDGFMVSVVAPGTISDVYGQATGLLEGAGFTEQASSDMGGMRTASYEANGAIASLGLTLIEDAEEGVVAVSYSVSKDK